MIVKSSEYIMKRKQHLTNSCRKQKGIDLWEKDKFNHLRVDKRNERKIGKVARLTNEKKINPPLLMR